MSTTKKPKYSKLFQASAKAFIQTKLKNDRKWLERAIVLLHENQTAHEQCNFQTSEANGVGYNGSDAEIMSKFAEWIKEGKHLSVKMRAISEKKMTKYWRQIMENSDKAKLEKAMGIEQSITLSIFDEYFTE